MSRHKVGLIGLFAMAACGPTKATITYSQLANFYQMDNHDPSQTGPVTSSTADVGEFVLYRIDKIQNSASTPFVFDSLKVVTVTPDKTIANTNPIAFPWVGNVTTVTVAPGATVDKPGCIVALAGATDPKSLEKSTALVDLLYQLDATPKATMTRASGNTATKTLPQAIAWPELLSQLCQGNG